MRLVVSPLGWSILVLLVVFVFRIVNSGASDASGASGGLSPRMVNSAASGGIFFRMVNSGASGASGFFLGWSILVLLVVFSLDGQFWCFWWFFLGWSIRCFWWSYSGNTTSALLDVVQQSVAINPSPFSLRFFFSFGEISLKTFLINLKMPPQIPLSSSSNICSVFETPFPTLLVPMTDRFPQGYTVYQSDRLTKQYLPPNSCIQSSDGSFRLCYQNDGNVVIYTSFSGPIWATMEFASNPGKLVMQSDGNLVGESQLC